MKQTNKEARKNDTHIEILLMEEGIYRVFVKNSCHEYQPALSQCLLGARLGGWFFKHGRMNRHCWVANSMWLERAESLITTR